MKGFGVHPWKDWSPPPVVADTFVLLIIVGILAVIAHPIVLIWGAIRLANMWMSLPKEKSEERRAAQSEILDRLAALPLLAVPFAVLLGYTIWTLFFRP